MQPNDIITEINGIDITTPIDFQKADRVPGETVTITVLRDEQEIDFPVVVTPSPDDPERGLIRIM